MAAELGTGQLVSLLPTPVTAALAGLNDRGIRLYDSIRIPEYPIPVGSPG
jgi:hypothetical protein